MEYQHLLEQVLPFVGGTSNLCRSQWHQGTLYLMLKDTGLVNLPALRQLPEVAAAEINRSRLAILTQQSKEHVQMSKNYQEIAQSIVANVGGKENILSVTHCTTRLRFELKDHKKANPDALKACACVAGVVDSANQYQIVIGNEINAVYDELSKMGLDTSIEKDSTSSTGSKGIRSAFNAILDVVAGCMTPLIPALLASGMVKAIVSLIQIASPDFASTSTNNILTFIGDSFYYFLPILIAVNAAKKFKVETSIAVVMATILIHPTFVSMVSSGEPVTLFGLNVPLVSYSSTVFPVIIVIWFMSYLQKFLNKIIPNAVRFFLVPTLELIICAPIALLFLAPIGNYLGTLLAAAISWLQSTVGILAIVIIALIYPFLVMFGMHHVLTPIMLAALTSMGYEGVILTGIGASNWAQTGACLGVALRTKNRETRQTALAALLSGVMGITEPALYGVNLKLKKPLFSACVAAAAAALLAGLFGVVYYMIPVNVFATFPSLVGDRGLVNLVVGILSTLLAFLGSAVITYLVGFNEEQ